MVDRVSWFRLADPDTRRSTWVCVDRPVYVALTLPDGSGADAITTYVDWMSDNVKRLATALGA